MDPGPTNFKVVIKAEIPELPSNTFQFLYIWKVPEMHLPHLNGHSLHVANGEYVGQR